MPDHRAPRGPEGRGSEPIFNVPSVVVGLLAVLAVVHLGRELLAESQDDWLVYALAFVPARYSGSAGDIPGAPWAAVTSLLTHAVVHGNVTHLGVNAIWLLAVGTPLAWRMTAVPFLAFTAVCAVGGALLFLLLNIGLEAPMVGASGAISGLMGAVFRLIYAADGRAGWILLREHPELAPRLSLPGLVRNQRAAIAIGVWVVMNFVFAFATSGTAAPGGIAWEAHLGGFFTGLLTFGLFDPGPKAES